MHSNTLTHEVIARPYYITAVITYVCVLDNDLAKATHGGEPLSGALVQLNAPITQWIYERNCGL